MKWGIGAKDSDKGLEDNDDKFEDDNAQCSSSGFKR